MSLIFGGGGFNMANDSIFAYNRSKGLVESINLLTI